MKSSYNFLFLVLLLTVSFVMTSRIRKNHKKIFDAPSCLGSGEKCDSETCCFEDVNYLKLFFSA